MKDKIEKKLQTLNPIHVEIHDESSKHHGHAGYIEGGETHFNIVVVSEAFSNCSAIDRQRKIYKLLAEEMALRIHALSMKLLTPSEWK